MVKEMGGEVGEARWGDRRAGTAVGWGECPAGGRLEGDRGVDSAIGWGFARGSVGAVGCVGEGDRPIGLEAIASKTPAPTISGLDQAPSTSHG